ncbi:MAG: low molecular weight phosphotyrosine protein phosphatase [Actinomycetota bacterium]|nr:low molecular weight phosphotyrosine protein phosphatase [Actinomycetota bacterium]
MSAVPRASAYRVVFVCTGNICRSPSAEAVMKQRVHEAGLTDAIHVSSAGLGGWHVGDDADARSLRALRARGYELAHSARQVMRSWAKEYDLFVALDSGHLMELRSLLPGVDARLLRDWDPRGSGNVPDPYYDGAEVFEEVLDMIERSCEGLLAELQRRLAA